ncbi:hypothetical protein GCM10009802_30070 [Streptomyces synnematoformans]|uniref:Uncharacterized protein n=2 Tax=Streptomyces synnematoformans TaxID=415721 RepID=A0ABN2YB93_9ACTN
MTNVEGGANSSRFALQVSGGGTQQEIEMPEESYRLALFASGDGGQVVETAPLRTRANAHPGDHVRAHGPVVSLPSASAAMARSTAGSPPGGAMW